MEQGAHVVGRQQRGRAGLATGEVVVVQHHRQLRLAVGAVAVLLGQHAHPGAAALGRAGKVVLQEQAHGRAVVAVHLVDGHIGVVAGQIGARSEAQAEQALGAFERGGHHRRQREVGLELGVVERVARLAHLLGPVAPVPGLQRVGGAGRRHGRAQQGTLGIQRGQGALPHVVEQGPHPVGRAGHGVGQLDVGIAGAAHQHGLALAQRQDLLRHRPVVLRTGVGAAADPGAPDLLAQIAPAREAQERQHQRPPQRDHRLRQATLGGGLAGGGTYELGQAVHRSIVRQRQGEGVLVVQQVLGEQRVQFSQLRLDGGELGPRIRRQLRALAGEVAVGAFHQAQLLGRQPQAMAGLVHMVDALEQPGILVDGAEVRGQRAGQRPLHRLQRGRRGRCGQVVEHRQHPAQQVAAAVEGRHGVGKVGFGCLRHQCGQLVAVHLHAALDGGAEVVGADACEVRQRQRRVAVDQQGVGGCVHRVCGAWPWREGR